MTTNTDARVELRVLVIDDNVDAATSLSYLLQILECKTAVAFGGVMGLRLMQLFQPALVFIDLDMPGQDGCEVLQQARAVQTSGADAMYVCLTGVGDLDTEQRCVAAGFNRFVRKPMEPEALAEVLGEARARMVLPGNVPSAPLPELLDSDVASGKAIKPPT